MGTGGGVHAMGTGETAPTSAEGALGADDGVGAGDTSLGAGLGAGGVGTGLDAGSRATKTGLMAWGEGLEVQLPQFVGDDPIGWVAKAEQQFEVHGTVPDKRIVAAVVVMDGAALYWVNWKSAKKPTMAWKEFTQALIARFDTQFQGNRYISLFIQLASWVSELSDAHYLGYFMNGVKSSILSSLRMLRPKDLEIVMELARKMEDTGTSKGILQSPFHFPDFNLEDKVVLMEDGVDMEKKRVFCLEKRTGLNLQSVGYII